MTAMDVDASPETPSSGLSAERALASLKAFAEIAWEECRSPLTDAGGSAQVRWEVYSTWTLLLCIYHTEAEAERCREGWKPQPWRTEAQALRHVFLESRSLRALTAVLRWLRWAHRWSPSTSSEGARDEASACVASYERTRRALHLQGSVSKEAPAEFFHPDGPLQPGNRFKAGDLQEEQQLLQELWICLRRGDLRGALKLCAESGQAWRTALLQGMLPFADSSDEPLGYHTTAEAGTDKVEELLSAMKEDHTDWTELGLLERSCENNGNPWRRIWKEQCFNTAQRNLRQGSSMDIRELGIYGFCSGHYDALMPSCGTHWADRFWGELHCLKEWLIERLLEDGRAKWRFCGDCPGCLTSTGRRCCLRHLGEGDAAWLDCEGEESQSLLSQKLCGRLMRHNDQTKEDLELIVAIEVRKLIRRLIPAAGGIGGGIGINWQVPPIVSTHFSRLQAILIETAWEPQSGEFAMSLLREWVSNTNDPNGPPFLVKQFSSYFAIWQKESLEAVAMDTANAMSTDDNATEPRQAAGPTMLKVADHLDVDLDVMFGDLVQELVLMASGTAWAEQCLKGQALELIAEHAAALRSTARIEAFSELLLCLGQSADHSAAAALESLNQIECVADPRVEVLKRCIWVFWSRFPDEIFALITVFVRRALHLDDERSQELELPLVGPAGVREDAQVSDISRVLLCLAIFWIVARDKSQGDVTDVSRGLHALLGEEVSAADAPTTSTDAERQEFLRASLEVILPLLTDTLLCLSVKEPEAALSILPSLQASMLWRDSFSSEARCTVNLNELEWYLGLCHRYTSWSELHLEAEAQRTAPGPRMAEELRDVARSALLDWARPRLAQQRPLLQALPATLTVLPDSHWEGLRRAVSCRVLTLLVDCFEGELDFEGAMQDLVVAVASSPWLLSMLLPRHTRAFLRRLSSIPTHLVNEPSTVRVD